MAVRDWRITISPSDSRCPQDGGTLDILRGEEEDALEALEGWAFTIKRMGFIPDNGSDFRSRSGAAVIKRQSKFTFKLRLDAYEFETDTGYSNGYAIMRAEESI